MITVYPSLIATPANTLKNSIHSLEPYCAGFHLDVADGHFVPTTAFSAQMVNDIDSWSKKPSWVHLMVKNPRTWCEQLILKPGSIVSFHIESEKDIPAMVKRIKENKWKASLVINPKTAVELSYPYLNLIDQLLIMSVNPGYSGQPFLPSALSKVAPLIKERNRQHLNFEIGMDGGINLENVAAIAAAKVDTIVVGSAIFAAHDPVQALQEIESLCNK